MDETTKLENEKDIEIKSEVTVEDEIAPPLPEREGGSETDQTEIEEDETSRITPEEGQRDELVPIIFDVEEGDETLPIDLEAEEDDAIFRIISEEEGDEPVSIKLEEEEALTLASEVGEEYDELKTDSVFIGGEEDSTDLSNVYGKYQLDNDIDEEYSLGFPRKFSDARGKWPEGKDRFDYRHVDFLPQPVYGESERPEDIGLAYHLQYDDEYVVPEKEEFQLTFMYMYTHTDRFINGKRELCLRGNDLIQRVGRRLRNSDMPIICKFLGKHSEVISLDVAYNELSDAGMLIIVHFLKISDSLKRLNVMGNGLGEKSIASLARLAEKMPLESLRVNGNKIGVEGGKCLGLLLTCNTNLKHLDVGETDQTLSSLAYFTTAMRYNETIVLLDMSRPLGTFMHSMNSDHWADTLGGMLQFNRTLRELHVQKSELIDHDMETLMMGLQYNTTLQLLDLSCNRLGDHSMEVMAKYLKQRPGLLGLLLAHNHIGDIGVRCLSFTMPYSKLQLLDVSYNKVTDEGLLDLLVSIKKPVMMRVLYIWGNVITDKSCQVLRRMLLSGVLHAERVDFRIYRVDGKDQLAYYPADRSNHIYYCIPDYAYPPQPRRIPKRRAPIIPTQRICPRIPLHERQQRIGSKLCPYGAPHSRVVGVNPHFCRK